ncbi:hypothetical protein L1887_10424 [Cichorium endivia]|nr:hypothetical protein L1887_10424 [Cichorium endivia]
MFTSIKHLTVVSRHSKALAFLYSSLPTTPTFLGNNFASPAHQTLLQLLEKCQSMKKLKSIHAQIILHGLHQETLTVSKLISFCAVSETGDLQYAQLLFDHLSQPNRYMYNSLIRGYANSDNPTKALHLYHQMVRISISPNEFTYPFVLKVCAVLSRLSDGVLVHVRVIKLGFESHVYVQNGLVSVYCSCGAINDSRKVFDEMIDKSLVSWNTMIGGYSKMGNFREAFLLFQKMRELDIEPDDFTFVSLLSSVFGRNCLQMESVSVDLQASE